MCHVVDLFCKSTNFIQLYFKCYIYESIIIFILKYTCYIVHYLITGSHLVYQDSLLYAAVTRWCVGDKSQIINYHVFWHVRDTVLWKVIVHCNVHTFLFSPSKLASKITKHFMYQQIWCIKIPNWKQYLIFPKMVKTFIHIAMPFEIWFAAFEVVRNKKRDEYDHIADQYRRHRCNIFVEAFILED